MIKRKNSIQFDQISSNFLQLFKKTLKPNIRSSACEFNIIINNLYFKIISIKFFPQNF